MILWTDQFSRHQSIQSSVLITEKILEKINKKKILTNKTENINDENFKNLYRPSIYLAVSIFIERLLRVSTYKNNYTDNKKNKLEKFNTYKHSLDFVLSSYYDERLNQTLLDNLCSILNKKNESNDINKNKIFIKKKYFYKRFNYILILKHLFKRIIIKILKYNFFFKNDKIIYDGSLWLESYFRKYIQFTEKRKNQYKINNTLRKNLEENFRLILKDEISKYLFINIPKEKKSNLSILFSKWIISSIPISLLENLEYKTNFYIKRYSKFNFSEIHSTTSLIFNDEFKIFSSIFKSRGKILIAHDHGVNNFIKYLDKNDEYLFTKLMPVLKFVDYYLAWGKNIKVNQWANVEEKYKLKILNFGSPYLNSINKNSYQKKIKKNKLRILYPGAPFKFYMTCLDEITPEENLIHKLNVSKLIAKLLDNYEIDLVYKNFNSSFIPYSIDPVVKFLKRYIDDGRIKLTNTKPIKIIKDFDLVLLDMLSTTFAETISIKVPSLIFSNKYDYSLLCDDGKKINNLMQKNKILFYEIDQGYECFKNFKNKSNDYFQENSELFIDYQEKIAYPQTLRNFDDQLNNLRN